MASGVGPWLSAMLENSRIGSHSVNVMLPQCCGNNVCVSIVFSSWDKQYWSCSFSGPSQTIWHVAVVSVLVWLLFIFGGLLGWLSDWSLGRSVGWSVAWLVGRLVGRVLGCFFFVVVSFCASC